MILRAAVVLLLACRAAADEPQTLVSRLGDADVEVRTKAEAELTPLCMPALPFLREACRSTSHLIFL